MLLCRYGFLPLKVRLELPQRLQSVSDAFPIDGLYYDSFLRRYGGWWRARCRLDVRTEFSAADVANAATALLEQCVSEGELVNEHVRGGGASEA